MILPQVTIIGTYQSPKIPVEQLHAALNELFSLLCTSQFNMFTEQLGNLSEHAPDKSDTI